MKESILEIIVRRPPHRSETNGIAERAVRRVKEGTYAVLLQSGLDDKWWADSMEWHTYLRNIQDLLSDREDSIRKTFWRNILKDPIIPFWFIGWLLPYFCERPLKNPSIWKESLTWIVPRIRSVRGGNLEGWHNGCRHWGAGNDGRIGNLLKKRLNAKGVIFLLKMEKSYFQSQMDE